MDYDRVACALTNPLYNGNQPSTDDA